jgi:predicted LPLAT superfamily acyltransferase
MLRSPVLLMVGVYRGGNRYDLYFEELMDMGLTEGLPRNELIRQAQQRYVARIEHYCRNAPYNWFNFYDFWKT